MLPLYDSIPVKSRVYVNWVIITLNMMVMVVVLNLTDNERADAFYHVGLIPALILSNPLYLFTLFTSCFFHIDLLHFLGNMVFLWIFGNNIEGIMGSWRYLVFYLFGGIAADVLHILTHATRTIPAIGASGSIAAVMGAYFLYFPHSKVIP